MATQTPNFNFDLRESADIFNPLSTNANFESLDTILKNLQETGGITTYTTTASANLLKLSGTPKVNDTVFKFVAAGDANTWTAGTGGVINNIVALDGKQATIKGGNMYVAWINSANAMVCVAWPDVVDAQTFDGKGPNEWATSAQLQAVNETAGNATQTAQAAATVANNALETAQAGDGRLTRMRFTSVNSTNITVVPSIIFTKNYISMQGYIRTKSSWADDTRKHTVNGQDFYDIATIEGNPMTLSEQEPESATSFRGVAVWLRPAPMSISSAQFISLFIYYNKTLNQTCLAAYYPTAFNSSQNNNMMPFTLPKYEGEVA